MWLNRRVGLVTLGGRRTRGGPVGDQRRVDGHAEADLPAEDGGQALLDLGAQPALELAAGELVDDLDDGLVAVQGDRGARLEPGPLVGLQLTDHRPPGLFEVGLRTDLLVRLRVGSRIVGWTGLLLHAISRSFPRLPRCHSTKSTYFSTTCEGARRAVGPSARATRRRTRVWIRLPRSEPMSAGKPVSMVDAGSSAPEVGWGTAGNLVGADANPREPSAASRHPQADPSLCHRGPVGGGPRGLTLWKTLAYRWPVTCRRAA